MTISIPSLGERAQIPIALLYPKKLSERVCSFSLFGFKRRSCAVLRRLSLLDRRSLLLIYSESILRNAPTSEEPRVRLFYIPRDRLSAAEKPSIASRACPPVMSLARKANLKRRSKACAKAPVKGERNERRKRPARAGWVFNIYIAHSRACPSAVRDANASLGASSRLSFVSRALTGSPNPPSR